MVFSSVIFLFVFLPFTLGVYFLIKENYRNLFLLAMSLIFYASGEPKFVSVIIASIGINYFMGLFIEYSINIKAQAVKKIALGLTVILNLSLLFYFKYTDFFITSFNDAFRANVALRNIALPIGISFFTFQGMSYTLDLYMGKVKVQKNPINIALYISLFPQLIAGPIVRYIDVNEQIDDRVVTLDKFSYGVKRFIYGLAKKVIIANNVGIVADQIFSKAPDENGIAIAWLGIICYTIQIYFDFSGYSDMAIGLGKMFGFDFLENFNYPYISTNMTEFWRRWHISLSTWFRDYVYIPLGGNRKGNIYINLFIVFFVTGMWHGASWNFIIWGLWHGLFLIIEKILKMKDIKFNAPKFVKWTITMIIVMLGWVLFRAPDLEYALKYIGVMFGIVSLKTPEFTIYWYLTNKLKVVLIISVLASMPLKKVFGDVYDIVDGTYLNLVTTKIYLVLIFFISLMYVMTSNYNPFIYFRF